jgi:2-phosphoglycerate kinase
MSRFGLGGHTSGVTAVRIPGDLIGREDELATLRAHLERARAGDPSLILVGGEAGIGKTRLLSELAAGAEGRVLWGAVCP